jgi:hypothetical protein
MNSIKEEVPKSSDKKNGTIKDKKYWIKKGIEVMHRENPKRKMIVDKIIRESKLIKNGESEIRKSFMVGISCHWLNDSGDYMKGTFFTNELLPYKDLKADGLTGT